MKAKLKVLVIFGIIIIVAFSCEKGPATTAPGFAVYKTKGDYFYNVSVGTNEKGELYHYPAFYNPRYNSISDGRIKITEDDTIYIFRARLIDGYIFGGEIGENSIFLDFTFKEYINYEIDNNCSGVPLEILSEHILDADPFLELYLDPNMPRKYEMSDTALINQMIRDNELGKYFEKIK
ncbi:MAG: hypothetical protein R6X28_05575 [Bacteroidales bacterium]